MSHGRVEKVSPDVWGDLLSNSPFRTRFVDPEFIEIFGAPVTYWGLDRKGVLIAGMPVINAAEFNSRSLPWCYYQGIIYHREIWRAAPAKRTQYEIEIAEELVTAIAEDTDRFSFSLHPSLGDVRGLDWVHYHDPALPRLQISPRYTAIVDLEGANTDGLRAACRSARRQEEGYAIDREELSTNSDGTIGELAALYLETFERQGVSPTREELEMLPRYAEHFLHAGAGKLLAVRNRNGEALSIALIFKDYDGTTHVPIVGTGDTRYGGTLLYFAILDDALADGAKWVDFNGANSPKRAYFKHSMGAKPVLYFDVSYDAGKRS
ncbi:MAG: GNAT family N-acetyltransferase [Boseongicola sp.]